MSIIHKIISLFIQNKLYDMLNHIMRESLFIFIILFTKGYCLLIGNLKVFCEDLVKFMWKVSAQIL